MLNIKEGLYFDAAQAVNEIEQFIRSEVHRLGKLGVVLGLSGGLDSTTCAFLCVRALGRAHVLTYLLPERDTDPQNIADAELVAQTLGLKATHIDISPGLASLGVYDLVSIQQARNRRLVERGFRWISRLSFTPAAFSGAIAITVHRNKGPEDCTRDGFCVC